MAGAIVMEAARAPRRRRAARRQRAQRHPSVRARPREPDEIRRLHPDGVRRAIPGAACRAPARRHARGCAAPPDVAHGTEDHHRFGDADEQGPRGHRGALAVGDRAGADRRRRPSAVDRALDGRARRWLDHRAARRDRHAAADSVRVLLPRALVGAASAAGSDPCRPPRVRAPGYRRGFPALRLAFQALEGDAGLPIVLNAANEVAVAEFLQHRLGFTAIPEVIAQAMDGLRTQRHQPDSRRWTTSGRSIGGRGSSPFAELEAI